MDTVMIEPLTTGDKVVNNNDSTDYLDSQLKIAQHEEDSDACFDEYQYGDGDDGQGCPDLDTSMKECLEIFRLYLNNRFEEANKMASKWEKHSIYYTLIKSLMSFLPAFLMIEKEEVESCRRQLSRSLSLVNRKRKQNSIVESLSSFMWKVNYDDFTEEEVHAELIFAEIKLFYMMLAFVSDQNLLGLIKAALSLRAVNNAYKLCTEIREHRKNWASPLSKYNFEGGVSVGSGFIQLVVSHLPTRVMRLLSLAGFQGDRDQALLELKLATDDYKEGIRYKAADFGCILYFTYLEQIFGAGEGDLAWAQRLVSLALEQFPTGVYTLLHAGRVRAVTGKPEEAIDFFERCIATPKGSSMQCLDNLCYWDLAWCHAILGDWLSAAKYAKLMRDNSKYSPASNQYMGACFMAMHMKESGDKALESEVMDMMKAVPGLRTRYLGKTLPPEKYSITKATQYIAGDVDVVLPAYELFYVWNIFSYGSRNQLEAMLDKVDAHVDQIKLNQGNSLGSKDDYYNLLLIRGVLLRNLNLSLEAIDSFKEILDNETKITHETHIPPHAAFELGLSYSKVGKLEDARHWLEKARNDYSGFLVESLVHLRVHSAINQINQTIKADKPRKPSIFKRMSLGGRK